MYNLRCVTHTALRIVLDFKFFFEVMLLITTEQLLHTNRVGNNPTPHSSE